MSSQTVFAAPSEPRVESDASSPVPNDGGAALSPTFQAMDATFRNTFAAAVVAQVRRSDWDAFVAHGGTLYRSAGHFSLLDGSRTQASAERVCTGNELKKRSWALEHLADDLESPRRSENDGKFICEKNTCSLYTGEFGFNGTMTFTREGDAVQLVLENHAEGGAVIRDLAKDPPPPADPPLCHAKR